MRNVLEFRRWCSMYVFTSTENFLTDFKSIGFYFIENMHTISANASSLGQKWNVYFGTEMSRSKKKMMKNCYIFMPKSIFIYWNANMHGIWHGFVSCALILWISRETILGNTTHNRTVLTIVISNIVNKKYSFFFILSVSCNATVAFWM